MTDFLQLVVTGCATGALYGLVALGLVLIFRGTNVNSFAHGDMVTVGAYAAVAVVGLGLPFPVVVLVTAAVGAVVATGVYFVAVAGLRRPGPHLYLISTLAIAFAVRALLRLWFGDYVYNLPSLFGNEVIALGTVRISVHNLVVIVVAAVLTGALFAFLRLTRTGMQVRAMSASPLDAQLLGIDVRRLSVLIWAISGVLAAVAGVLLAPYGGITPELGWILIPAFVGAVIGGFTSLVGALVGGLLVGVFQNLVGYYVDTSIRDIGVFALLIVFLAYRPNGLFGEAATGRV